MGYIPFRAPQGKSAIENKELPLLRGTVDALPRGMAALVLTSDLQGREDGGDNRALGVVVAHELSQLAKKRALPPASRTGVILAGDLFTEPTLHKRFGNGDVSDVWAAFAESFRWVTGVLGNVDTMASKALRHYGVLDGNQVELDGLAIGGVSGIIGDARKKSRRSEADFVAQIARCLRREPDILVLHEGPNVPGLGLRGTEAVRRALREAKDCLVVCGHNYWQQSMVSMGRDVTIVNTDSKVIILSPAARAK